MAKEVLSTDFVDDDPSGRKLNADYFNTLGEAVNESAPTAHSSTASTYGLGTTANYGHVKTINSLARSSFASGEALSAYQGYLLDQKIADVAETAAGSGSPSIFQKIITGRLI